jgi:hypothetical protein
MFFFRKIYKWALTSRSDLWVLARLYFSLLTREVGQYPQQTSIPITKSVEECRRTTLVVRRYSDVIILARPCFSRFLVSGGAGGPLGKSVFPNNDFGKNFSTLSTPRSKVTDEIWSPKVTARGRCRGRKFENRPTLTPRNSEPEVVMASQKMFLGRLGCA